MYHNIPEFVKSRWYDPSFQNEFRGYFISSDGHNFLKFGFSENYGVKIDTFTVFGYYSIWPTDLYKGCAFRNIFCFFKKLKVI